MSWKVVLAPSNKKKLHKFKLYPSKEDTRKTMKSPTATPETAKTTGEKTAGSTVSARRSTHKTTVDRLLIGII